MVADHRENILIVAVEYASSHLFLEWSTKMYWVSDTENVTEPDEKICFHPTAKHVENVKLISALLS